MLKLINLISVSKSQGPRVFIMKLAVFTLLQCFPYTAGSKLPATGSLTDNLRNLIQCISMTVSSGNDPEFFCTPQVK